jgi:hypothetical protein
MAKRVGPKICCVEGCGAEVYCPRSNPYFKHCLPHYLMRKNEQRARRELGLSNGHPGHQHTRTVVPDDEGYQPKIATSLKGLSTPGFGL